MDGWFPLGGLYVNGYFVRVGLRGKILRRLVGAAPVCPPVSPSKGAFIVHPPRIMRVFLVWKRRCADVRVGTQAPPLRILLERITRGCSPLHISFGQIACVVLFVGKTVHMNQHHRCCTFDSPGLPTIGGLPWVKSWRGIYAIGIVLFLINPRMRKPFANNPFGTV